MGRWGYAPIVLHYTEGRASMEEILARLLAFQIIIDLISVTVGAGLCFDALKWRRGHWQQPLYLGAYS